MSHQLLLSDGAHQVAQLHAGLEAVDGWLLRQFLKHQNREDPSATVQVCPVDVQRSVLRHACVDGHVARRS